MLRLHERARNLLVVSGLMACLFGSNSVQADLIFHFDPNDTRTTFQNGFEDNRDGTIPALNVGDPVGWIMDTRVPSSPPPDPDNGADTYIDAQNGNFGNKPIIGYHPNGNVLNFPGSGNNDSLLLFRNNAAKADGYLTAADGNSATIVVAGRIDPSGTAEDYIIDFRDDSPIGGGADANNGLALRYNHATQMLEGIVKQSVATSVPMSAGQWFVATLGWNGAGASATMDVRTASGTLSDSGAAEATALNSDRARIGSAANSTLGLTGQLGEVLFYNDVLDHSSVATQLLGNYINIPELVINRDTGNVSISLPGAAASIVNVVGYSMTSESGALNPVNWTSIADNYDADNPGANQLDPNNQWIELSSSAGNSDLTEFEFQDNGGANNGADFLSGKTISLGNAWVPYHREDIRMELSLDDGTLLPLLARYTGGGGRPFQFGDLDLDGDIDQNDFLNEFVPNFDDDTSTIDSAAVRYGFGDLNTDGLVDIFDFLLLNEAYLNANPGATSLSFSAVPEPATCILIAFAPVALALRRKRRANLLAMLAVVFVLLAARTESALADLLGHWKFDETAGATTLIDAANNFDGAAANGATGGAIGKIGGAWAFDNAAFHYVDLTPHVGEFEGLAEGTISTWFKRPTAGGAGALITLSDSAVGSTEGRLFFEANDLRYDVRDQGGNPPQEDGFLSAGNWSDDAWHHVALTVDANHNAVMYVDGEIRATGLESFWGPIGTLNAMSIGRNRDDKISGEWYFNGSLDDMQIYDTALVGPAIEAIYDGGLNGQSVTVTETALKLEVNTANGQVTLANDAVFGFDIDAYRITSQAGSLNGSPAWSGLGGGWTKLGNDSEQLSEGFLGGSQLFAASSMNSLGQAFDVGSAQDLVFEYHLAGESATTLRTGAVEYVTSGGVDGDYNANGIVDAADYTIWRDTLGQNVPAGSGADGDANGAINQDDYTFWKQRFGNTSGSGAVANSTAVPEPASILIVGCALFAGLLCRHRGLNHALLLFGCVLTTTAASQADVFLDRSYTLGDDPAESAAANSPVGAATFDSSGVNLSAFPGAINSGAYQDLNPAGTIQYVDVGPSGLKRPGAGSGGAGTLGALFDGVDDRLSTAVSLNSPSVTWRTTALFPTGSDLLYDPPSAASIDGTGDGNYRPAFPHDYAGIHQRGIQAWVRPDISALGQGRRQDIVIDTNKHGFFITAADTWGLQFDDVSIDSGVLVTNTLDANGWVHLMETAGISRTHASGIPLGGALLVNGTVVTSSNGEYEPVTTGLSIGSNLAGDANFFQGAVDELELFIWGNNSARAPAAGNQTLGYLGGADWGKLNASDNRWIERQLTTLAAQLGVPSIPDADVNLDGVVAGNGTGSAATDDVRAFIDKWMYRNEVGAIPAGDWTSRQNGDLNFDGVADIRDAILLRDTISALGTGSFDLSLLAGGQVPEPTTAAMGVGILAFLCFARKHRPSHCIGML